MRCNTSSKQHLPEINVLSELHADVPRGEMIPGARALLGCARRFNPSETRSVDEIMRDLRAGDLDESE